MITANQSFNEFKYGAKLQGSNTSIGQFYSTLTATTNGVTPVSVFALATNGNTTAPVAGTVTAFMVNANVIGGAGTAVLWATTAGTIATIIFGLGTMTGLVYGTNVLAASIVAGDTLQVSSVTNVGTAACYVTFVTSA